MPLYFFVLVFLGSLGLFIKKMFSLKMTRKYMSPAAANVTKTGSEGTLDWKFYWFLKFYKHNRSIVGSFDTFI